LYVHIHNAKTDNQITTIRSFTSDAPATTYWTGDTSPIAINQSPEMYVWKNGSNWEAHIADHSTKYFNRYNNIQKPAGTNYTVPAESAVRNELIIYEGSGGNLTMDTFTETKKAAQRYGVYNEGTTEAEILFYIYNKGTGKLTLTNVTDMTWDVSGLEVLVHERGLIHGRMGSTSCTLYYTRLGFDELTSDFYFNQVASPTDIPLQCFMTGNNVILKPSGGTVLNLPLEADINNVIQSNSTISFTIQNRTNDDISWNNLNGNSLFYLDTGVPANSTIRLTAYNFSGSVQIYVNQESFSRVDQVISLSASVLSTNDIINIAYRPNSVVHSNSSSLGLPDKGNWNALWNELDMGGVNTFYVYFDLVPQTTITTLNDSTDTFCTWVGTAAPLTANNQYKVSFKINSLSSSVSTVEARVF
jgi:hypothetical protein